MARSWQMAQRTLVLEKNCSSDEITINEFQLKKSQAASEIHVVK